MPDVSDIMVMGAEKIQISDTTMLMLRNQGLSAGQRCIKRIFDIVVGVVAMIVSAYTPEKAHRRDRWDRSDP